MQPSRRRFLRTTLATSSLVSMGTTTVPSFLARSARAAAENESKERVLVVVQLLGGNDGLNTVVPHTADGYIKARRALRLPSGSLHKVTDEIALHPGMGQVAKLLESGRLSIVQGVGYPNPDRSHFRSMEIWETARSETGALETGWLGRGLDAHPVAPGADLPALQFGARSALALQARSLEVPAVESLEQYRLQLEGDAAARSITRDRLDAVARPDRAAPDPLLAFVRRTTLAAFDSSRRLEELNRDRNSGDSGYPNYGLARRLEQIASLIKAGFGTRIYYTALDGFDTHANQLASHAALLTELSDSVAAFDGDLKKSGHGDRVAVLCFSEFGRRVAENASAGTDHGAAAPVLVAGPVQKPGLVGAHPGFDDLDDGDLKHHTDFRRVYASVLEQWLGWPSAPLLGEGFPPLDLFAART